MTEREAVRLALACLADPGDAVCRLALADALEEMGRDVSHLRKDGWWGIEWTASEQGLKAHWLIWWVNERRDFRHLGQRVCPLRRRDVPRRRCVPPCRPLVLLAQPGGWRWTCAGCGQWCDLPFAPPPAAR